jgi:LysR family transcriptional activator of nhaA
MRHLNYHHLLYFWTTAREGSVARAAQVLHLTPQTISGQIKRLEQDIGGALFEREGRGLALTETGRLVAKFADEIFSLGQELAHAARSDAAALPRFFHIGIVNSIPKLVGFRLIEPALGLAEQIRLIIHEGTAQEMLRDLTVHRLDVVISDRPGPAPSTGRLCTYLLEEGGVSFFAAPGLADTLSADFPHSLNGAPMIMPAARNALRARLDDWLDAQGIYPRIVAEIDDTALIKAFGNAGVGVFVSPTSIADDIARTYGAIVIGSTQDVHESFYALVADRRVAHPAIQAMTMPSARPP